MPKALTREQLVKRKEQAARFVGDVLGDPDRAGEIAENRSTPTLRGGTSSF